MAAAIVIGVPFSAARMASTGLSERLIVAVVAMEVALLTEVLIKVSKPDTQPHNRPL
ncbi:hypothetical protein FHS29_005581 [Saccharothrix tamanrassetensis]|uniref:Uncharacterized protein n=1 Tax=Saccharothrix tamanrassetensis TaxID=1051531 RepID=A0A841CKE0_9PSEU|nr:hypothetical protein [Saccharothrix tamanrassetensis]MBB5958972.1 hypothetical protein [Saccharothrix tamanrassetensis]